MGYKPPYPRYLARQKLILIGLPLVPMLLLYCYMFVKIIFSIYFNILTPLFSSYVFFFVFICVSIGIVIIFLLYRRQLRREMNKQEFCVCIRCGYFVGDRPNNTPCPECGLPINFLYFKERWQKVLYPNE